MLDREKLLSQARDTEEKEAAARGIDLAEGVLRYHRPQVSDFYDPFHVALVCSILEAVPDTAVTCDGGYPGAERKRILVHPDYMTPGEEDAGLSFLSAEGNFNFARLSHRDFLGSLLGLGIKREKIGDILVQKAGAQVITARDVADYIRLNLERVGRNGVQLREISRQDLSPPAQEVKQVRTTVPSMRLDVVAAAAFSMSRGKMAREISAQKVALNWRICTRQSAEVAPGDMLSLRGKGRARVEEITGNTKKGRMAVLIKRFV